MSIMSKQQLEALAFITTYSSAMDGGMVANRKKERPEKRKGTQWKLGMDAKVASYQYS